MEQLSLCATTKVWCNQKKKKIKTVALAKTGTAHALGF